jgi:hypothetical protein
MVVSWDFFQTLGVGISAARPNNVIGFVPVQREMESERSPLGAKFRPSGGDVQGMRVYRSDVVLGRAQKRTSLRSDHRLDEPTRLSLGMVASQQCPLPFHLAQSL